jgi:ribulose-5-phosphate 4-epimerase/fuculose-1-phosphate aldolase
MPDSAVHSDSTLYSETQVRQVRVDLAASFRWFVKCNMHEGVSNHFSAAVSPDGSKFLMNPRGVHFSRVTASTLQLLDAHDKSILETSQAPDPTAWYIHGRLHAKLPQARCIMHLHPKYATALSALADSRILPIDQTTMRFTSNVAYDESFGGMALSDEEGDRLAGLMGKDKTVMMMGNHGVLVAASSVAMAFDLMYHLERACETQMIAMATGQKLRIASDNVAKMTAQQWDEYPGLADDHLREVKALLDRAEPDYRN